MDWSCLPAAEVEEEERAGSSVAAATPSSPLRGRKETSSVTRATTISNWTSKSSDIHNFLKDILSFPIILYYAMHRFTFV